MKRFLLILTVAVLAAAGCTKKVPSQQLVYGFAQHFDKDGDRYTEQLVQLDPGKRADFITLQLSRAIKAADIWSIDFEYTEKGPGADSDTLQAGETKTGEAIVAELQSREKDPTISMISACLDDPAACAAVLDVLDAFKKAKLRPAFAVRAVFFDGGSTGTDGLKAVADDFVMSNELAAFDIHVSSNDTIPERTFIIEDKLAFASKIVEIIPEYLQPVCDVDMLTGEFPRKGWPTLIPTYRYRLGSDRITDLKALTAFTFLLN